VGGIVKRIGKKCRDCGERFALEADVCPKCGSRKIRVVTTLG